ncbi:YkvA family protein [Brevibacillus sp. GCM10020057]|uniref:YkvA family protein n=1 Tax=Brevibacillus sp. GCM10020057 TaxID=3317327 RepID=UPI0036271957
MNEEDTKREESGTSPQLPALRQPAELVPVKLPEKHQRFYDKLREKIEAFIRDKGVNETAASYILLAPDLFVLLARLMLDKRVSVQAKAVAGVAVAYFIAPVDFIPEVIVGGLGLLDDVILAVYALRRILVDVDEAVVREHWNGQDDLLSVITKVVKSADDLVGKKIVKKLEETLFRKK